MGGEKIKKILRVRLATMVMGTIKASDIICLVSLQRGCFKSLMHGLLQKVYACGPQLHIRIFAEFITVTTTFEFRVYYSLVQIHFEFWVCCKFGSGLLQSIYVSIINARIYCKWVSESIYCNWFSESIYYYYCDINDMVQLFWH